MTHSFRQKRVWIDVGLAVSIGIAAATLAFAYVSAHYAPNTGDDDTYRSVSAMAEPYLSDVLYPCVNQFGSMPEPAAVIALPAWRAFITRKTGAFPCEALSRIPIVPDAYNIELHGHLHWAMSSVFALTGPRLAGFAYYQAIQYGIFLALLFGIFRLGMGRIPAALAMIPLAVSPRHLEMALAPIEYAKAPFFAASLLGIGLLVCVRMPARVAYAVALASGVIAGLGLGFKPDNLVFVPFGLIGIAAFARTPEAGAARRPLVIAAYLAGVIAAGAPMIQTHFLGPRRSLLPIQVLGGMAPNFAPEYAAPAIYDYGIQFDDGYVTAAINSYNQRVNGSTEFGLFYSAVIQRGAADLVLRLQRTFAADMLLRTYAAIRQVFQFLPGGAIAALLVIFWLCRVDRRLALFVVFVVVYMVGYVSLVFAPKHYFHLEFVPWWFAGCAAGYVGAMLGRRVQRAPESPNAEPTGPRHSWRAAAMTVIAAVAVAAGALAAARLYQDRQVRPMFAQYVEQVRFEELGTQSLATATSATLLIPDRVSVAEGQTPLVPPPPGQLFSSPRVVTDYLNLRVRCAGTESGDVVAVYRRPTSWRDRLTIPCEHADQAWTVMWPVYQHLPEQVFEGFEYPGPAVLRVDGISRVKDLAGYPLLLRLRLPDDWMQRPLHHVLNLAAVSPTRVRPVLAALSSPPPPLAPPAVSWDPPFVQRPAPLSTEAPRLNTWTALDGVSVAAVAAGFVVRGDNSPFGYQVSSPPIAVPRHSKMVIRIFGEVEQGRVALGILDADGHRWVKPPVWGRSDFVANTGDNDRVFLVFANDRQPADGSVVSRFTVESITYDIHNSPLDSIRTFLWPVSQ